ncbi:MAG: hypothetical protein GW810_00050 [Flavobacteriales bacterium]|nr:hypothetical protein [Flavobacteriales bacterium]
MDIQQRKIEFVQQFLNLQNEEVITRLEQLLHAFVENNEFKPMSVAEFNQRIDKSMEDSKNDLVISSNDLISEIETWG